MRIIIAITVVAALTALRAAPAAAAHLVKVDEQTSKSVTPQLALAAFAALHIRRRALG